MSDELRPVSGYENLYAVSNDGFIYSYRTKKILKTYLAGSGYKYIKLHKNKVTKAFSIHRLVAINFLANPDGYKEVNHIDGNKLNNHINNLEWCSRSQNNTHAYKIGLKKAYPQTGSKHGNTQMTEKDIIDIRLFYSKGISLSKISIVYPVTKSTIWKIIKKMSWRHI